MKHSRVPAFHRLGFWVSLSMSILAAAPALADSSSFSAATPAAGADGAAIYGHICQGCHMPQAQGAVGAGRYPKLAGDPALVSWEYVAVTVLNGRKAMPAFGAAPEPGLERFSAHLSDAQVAAVVNYVRSHFGNRYKSTVTAQQVSGLPHPDPAGAP